MEQRHCSKFEIEGIVTRHEIGEILGEKSQTLANFPNSGKGLAQLFLKND